ncbi:SDR family NAD(P)-dependent oxidoreductase [Streptomyces misionensis]|uniref:SDR family NAD(P)-dependent oxidoreductase n=1 Tax=Streptomyces misionensis TaxID=67331 RepID=UPI0036F73AE4
MPRVFITGSTDGLGLMLGRLLTEEHHEVVLHARNEQRAASVRQSLPTAAGIVVGDVSTVEAMRSVAEDAAAHGTFDAVVHNVGIGFREPRRVETVDGLSHLWAVNVLAPYVLTALMPGVRRLVYLASGMHLGSEDTDLRDANWVKRRWNGAAAYSDSKFQDVLLAFAIARRWPHVSSNAVSPGWVATRMGGPGARDDLDQAHRTQGWLVTSDAPEALATGRLLYHRAPGQVHPDALDRERQDRLLRICAEASGVPLPAGPQ